jgi:hypothetical protein
VFRYPRPIPARNHEPPERCDPGGAVRVLVLDGPDISLAGVALPSIKRELGLDDSQASPDPVDSVARSRSGSVVKHDGPDCQLRRR